MKYIPILIFCLILATGRCWAQSPYCYIKVTCVPVSAALRLDKYALENDGQYHTVAPGARRVQAWLQGHAHLDTTFTMKRGDSLAILVTLKPSKAYLEYEAAVKAYKTPKALKKRRIIMGASLAAGAASAITHILLRKKHIQGLRTQVHLADSATTNYLLSNDVTAFEEYRVQFFAAKERYDRIWDNKQIAQITIATVAAALVTATIRTIWPGKKEKAQNNPKKPKLKPDPVPKDFSQTHFQQPGFLNPNHSNPQLT